MILSDVVKNAMLQGFVSLLNTSNNCSLFVYIDAELAAEIPLPNPVELDITAGVLSFKPSAEVVAFKSGTPTSAHLKSASGEVLAQYLGSELTLSESAVEQGGYINLRELKVRI